MCKIRLLRRDIGSRHVTSSAASVHTKLFTPVEALENRRFYGQVLRNDNA